MKASPNRAAIRAAVSLVTVLALAGCGTWFGQRDDPPLPGERISVLAAQSALAADPRIANLPVAVPRAISNAAWPQAGGTPDHAPLHLELPEELSLAWSRSIGSGSSRERRLLSAPIVVGNRVYVLNAALELLALSADNGERIWSVNLNPDRKQGGFGGGIAFDNGRIFAATGFAQLIALNADSGEELWRSSTTTPVRAAPTVADGRVFALTVDSRLQTFAAENGELQWTGSGIAEAASLLGNASPAYSQGLVLAPFSSGEVIAYRAEDGRQIWADSLTAVRRVDSVSELSDIRGLPVIYRGFAFATSNSGRTVAIDMRSGNRAWDQDFGGVSTPWLAGDFLFMVSNENELIAVLAGEGRVRWVRELTRYADPDDRSRPVIWFGPVLAGERLYLSNSLGRLVAVSPYSGEILAEIELAGRAMLPPVVASRSIYMLTDDGTLSVYR